jgi:predicted regulator of Ras-like GTPase activity (Roadblock/LC7/MglB family)
VPFKRILTELVEAVPGATGAILADWEGESVDQHCLYDDYELKVLAAHKGIILSQMRTVQADLADDTLRDAVITTELQHVVIGGIGDDYSLVMTLDRNAIVGLALRHFRGAVASLYKEIY